ncbi:hypothetical protein UPYG_G00211230 [Umbra pygmaea]|uniref:Uncharacterized protein n=1 Tax=Umbra pygmaea TaxID=75934 RepID=A0ABD0X605_UMBPY
MGLYRGQLWTKCFPPPSSSKQTLLRSKWRGERASKTASDRQFQTHLTDCNEIVIKPTATQQSSNSIGNKLDKGLYATIPLPCGH